MLSTQESLALHCALILGLPEPQAAKAAGIPQEAAAKAIAAVETRLPGRKVDFNRLMEGDPLLLRYEIQLARLEYQHDECLQSWRATKEHAEQLAEKFPGVVDEKERPRKPFVGDIRFLQLAKQIRREMEKIEKAIAQRQEELQKPPHAVSPSPPAASTTPAPPPAVSKAEAPPAGPAGEKPKTAPAALKSPSPGASSSATTLPSPSLPPPSPELQEYLDRVKSNYYSHPRRPAPAPPPRAPRSPSKRAAAIRDALCCPPRVGDVYSRFTDAECTLEAKDQSICGAAFVFLPRRSSS